MPLGFYASAIAMVCYQFHSRVAFSASIVYFKDQYALIEQSSSTWTAVIQSATKC